MSTGRDMPCPWCKHVHHFLPCEECDCPPHPQYPGEDGDPEERAHARRQLTDVMRGPLWTEQRAARRP